LKRQLLAIALLLTGLLSLGWWIRELMQPPLTVQRSNIESPAYIAEQLTVLTYGTNGQLEQKLITPLMSHYESRATTELSQPVLWRYNPDAQPWRIQAEKALVYSDDNKVFMSGEVVMDRNASAGQPPYHLVTRDLTYRTTDAYASTEQAVRIESDQQWITGIGLQGWLKQPIRINLLHKVRGYYVFN
jgi:LPS export ABC transporter protein LptC